MSRFVALYRAPEDRDQFEQDYRESHLPLLTRTPGLTRIETSTVSRTLAGDPAYFLMAVLYFADATTLKAAMRSPEWAESGQNLAEIGGLDLATMFLLEEPSVLQLDAHRQDSPRTTKHG